MPDIGGWIFISFGAIVSCVAFLEWRASRKKVTPGLKIVPVMFLLVSCSGSFKQINYGKDACDNCRMTIVDKKFALEIVSFKGKAFKFDDIICVKQFIDNKKINPKEIGDIFVNNYSKPGEFIKLKESFPVTNEWLKSPMNGNVSAFASREEAARFIETHGGDLLTPQSIIKTE
jgi:copper chaperone NosL